MIRRFTPILVLTVLSMIASSCSLWFVTGTDDVDNSPGGGRDYASVGFACALDFGGAVWCRESVFDEEISSTPAHSSR